MPRKNSNAAATTAWLGAPPVATDAFAFANGDFFAEASGQNRHRRATLGELKEHFSSGSEKDHPAHWYEAQLIHYGLKPSKTKSVARMRLYDAVNASELTVPTHLSTLESTLRKEWAKKDREAKKGLKTATASETKKKTTTVTTQKATGTKRKANDNTDAIPTSGPSIPHGTKKAKTTPSKGKSSPTASSSAKISASNETTSTTSASTPRRGGMSRGSTRGTSMAASSAIRSRALRRGGVSQGPDRGGLATISSSASSSRHVQTARRSAPFAVRGRILAPQSRAPCSDDDRGDDESCWESGHDEDTSGEDVTLAALGCVNGRYTITCPYVADNWPQYGLDYDLVLTISGSSLWATFDLGAVQGVMYFPDSPRQSSYDPVPFKWRGRESEGVIMYGDRNEGWIKFLGSGRIEGQFHYHKISFSGRRRPGPATVSPIDARTMQNRWNGYSEEEYERENLARWR